MRLIVASVLLLTLAACEIVVERPGSIYELTDAGLVESVKETDDGFLVTLARGETVPIGLDSFARSLYGGSPDPGELLVVSQFRTTTGWTSLRPLAGGCREILPVGMWFLAEPALDDGSHVVFVNGLRLPKVEGFEPGVDEGQTYQDPRAGFAINSAGEVVAYCGRPTTSSTSFGPVASLAR